MKVNIQKLNKSEIISVSQLIEKAFMESVAPTLTNKGIDTFKTEITPESIENRLISGNIFITCKNKNNIVGVGEIRNNNHLNLLFVEPCQQRKGIGRKLLLNLIEYITKSEITVNSSLNAVNAYKNLGFIKCAPENKIQGIKYQPMVYTIKT
jgi:GNAT superfamily N-acetyltransferase